MKQRRRPGRARRHGAAASAPRIPQKALQQRGLCAGSVGSLSSTAPGNVSSTAAWALSCWAKSSNALRARRWIAGRRVDLCSPGHEKTIINPPPELHGRVAATEVVDGKPLIGVVHDENARSMGGVSGNAGLFCDGGGPRPLCPHAAGKRPVGRTPR